MDEQEKQKELLSTIAMKYQVKSDGTSLIGLINCWAPENFTCY
jgi:hypothetical protein